MCFYFVLCSLIRTFAEKFWNMSEEKMIRLSETLSSLNSEEQAWVINFLVQRLAGLHGNEVKKARKIHHDDLTVEQWEDYFAHEPAVALPEETLPMTNVLNGTSGKTIEPMKKWL